MSAQEAVPGVRIKHIHVQTREREVPVWDQPIVKSAGEGIVTLYCGRSKGILHFLFHLKYEPGLYNHFELTPSIALEPGKSGQEDDFEWPTGEVIAECHQSEEGGRFYQDSNHYRIIDTGTVFNASSDCFWLTLKDIRLLLDEEGWFTNEARSVLSLLLRWL